MPYITQEDRKLYDVEIQTLVTKLVQVFHDEPTKISRNRAGHLNYIFTKILKEFYFQLEARFSKPRPPSPMNYSEHNEVIGMLECCKQEWYRKFTAPYEDDKADLNGDV